MKWSFASVGVIVAGLTGIAILLLFEQLTTTNENDYYLLKEITEAAMIDSIDLSYYRETGELKIVEEKFVETFTRRFAESTLLTGTGYKLYFYDVVETPPKVTVTIDTSLGKYTIYQDTSDYNVKNTLSAILEYTGVNTNVSVTSPVYNNPYKSKTYSKTYYSIPTVSSNGQVGAVRALNVPDELQGEHIKNVKINKVDFLGIINEEEELLTAKLNREIDWADVDPNSTEYDSLISDYATSLIENPSKLGTYNCNMPSNMERPTAVDCSKHNYWFYWNGTTTDTKKTDGTLKKGIVAKFKITWSYDEYEYYAQ